MYFWLYISKFSGCGKCKPCKSVDCGSCKQCLQMKKFSGDTDDYLLICDRRQCENSDIQMLNSSFHEGSKYNRKKTAPILLKEDVCEETVDTCFYSKVIFEYS